MSRATITLLAFILINNCVLPMEICFTDITDILHFGRETVTGLLETVEWTRQSNAEDHEYDFPFVKKMERRLMNEMSTITRKLENFQEKMQDRSDEIISTIIGDLSLRNSLERSLYELMGYMASVDRIYKNYITYAKDQTKYTSYTKEDFAQSCVSSRSGALPDLLANIHRMIVPSQFINFENSLLVLLAQNPREASTQICNEKQSPQQLLYNLYNTIALTEMKGYTMMQFSYTLLRLYNNGSFNEEMKQTEREFTVRTSETMRAVKTAMAFAPRELWRCDPGVHKEGSTYEEFKQLFQGYIVNEVDLNPTLTCKENCGYYNFASVNGCYANQFCSQQRRCNGKVLNCQYVDSDMWICPSSKWSDTRRYQYIQYENGRVYGDNKSSCPVGTTKVDSWWRWLFWHCSYCMCTCDDHDSKSERYVSLREATSDVVNNKVITGIKLTKTNKIIHLQIQEGILLPRAGINESSVTWKNIDNFTTLDRNVENGRDFHTLAWESRALDLDDLVGLESQLLTGVRFRLVGTHLNFEIRVTPFNFTSGELIKPMERSSWLSNDNTESSEKPRTEFKLTKPDIPTRTRAPSQPDSRTNQYLNFVPTDLEKDVAQTTVPFFDVQSVATTPAFPLSGAGIFHKGREGYGGFVALRVVTYDFTKHLQADLPPPTPVVGVNEITAF